VNTVVQSVLRGLKTQIEERELTVERRLPTAATEASLDPELITRVAHHLLDNAVKFTPPGGTIRITTALVDGGVHLSIQDSGPGITAEQLPHIFEPFYRADEARSRGTGTGLGLAMAAAIVRLHGGTLRASNVVDGSGARFDIELPL
jgi:signal transduction histidine kinase